MKIKKIKLMMLMVLIVGFLGLISYTHAAEQVSSTNNDSCESTGEFFGPTLNCYLENIYLWSIGIAGLLAIIMLMYAGYEYATSLGNPEQINTAKEIIVGALAGLALLIIAALIVQSLGIGGGDNSSNNSSGNTNNITAEQSKVVDAANKLVGKSYKSPGCTAFVKEAFNNAGLASAFNFTLDTETNWNNSAKFSTISNTNLQPGDVLYFHDTYGTPCAYVVGSSWPCGTITHTAIYLGNGQMAHQGNATDGVRIVSFDDFLGGDKFQGAKRYY